MLINNFILFEINFVINCDMCSAKTPFKKSTERGNILI